MQDNISRRSFVKTLGMLGVSSSLGLVGCGNTNTSSSQGGRLKLKLAALSPCTPPTLKPL